MSGPKDDEQVTLSAAQWREKLNPDQYRIAREGGTERAFSGKFWDMKTDKSFRCICCNAALFDGKDKYDSGSGWPSFTKAGDGANVATVEDKTHGMVRTEVRCAKCEAHLGHVFPDGPGPEGLRFCINSASLELDDEDDAGGTKVEG